jgi:hypothetical protein
MYELVYRDDTGHTYVKKLQEWEDVSNLMDDLTCSYKVHEYQGGKMRLILAHKVKKENERQNS